MGVLSVQTSVTGLVPNTSNTGFGQTQQLPTVIYINTNDTIATVTATGYLNEVKSRFQVNLNSYQMALVYTTDQGNVWLRVVVSSGNYTLESTAAAGLVALPTVINQIVYPTSTDGALAAAGVTRLFNAGGIDAGLSGTAGTFRTYPATAANGYLEIFGTANGGARNVTVTNAAHGQTSAYTIPDVGAATGGVMVSTTPVRTKVVVDAAAAGGDAAQSFTDAFCTATSVVLGHWTAQANPASILTIVPGAGSFVVTSDADAGAGTFSYTITKA